MTDITDLRRSAGNASLHPESLLNIPLVRHAYSDLSFQLVARNTDAAWAYNKLFPITLTGFNPFEFSFYYGHHSRFAAWLSDPFASARDFNEGDLLLREVLFMAHDYLHAWAYAVIDELRPSLRILNGAITAETLEEYTFCHLLTEAVATVGLDYWLLCNNGVNDFCPIGSNMGTLTVDYRESRLPEYRRFCPGLMVQTPDFFRTIAVFYCTGQFPGFGVDDIKRSPQLLRWLRHELSYGVTQRKLARAWLAYMAAEPIPQLVPSLDAPLDVEMEERSRLIEMVGQRLWVKVKEDIPMASSGIRRSSSRPARRSPPDRSPDFRFVNLARIPAEQWAGMQPETEENFKFFLYQFLGQLSLSSVPKSKLKHIPLLLQQRSVSLVLDLFGDLQRRDALPGEPRDLLIAN